MVRPYTAHPKYYECLGYVATVAEVARRWYRSRSTVRDKINTGMFAAEQSESTWLISVPSVVAVWGLPPSPTEPDRTLQGARTALQKTVRSGPNADSVCQQATACKKAGLSLSGVRGPVFRKAPGREILLSGLPSKKPPRRKSLQPKTHPAAMRKTQHRAAAVTLDNS